MRIFSILLFLFSLVSPTLTGQNTRFLEKLMKNNPSFDSVLAKPELYQIQILYSQINRDAKNEPSFKEYSYALDHSNYFYPGNAVNLPAAALVLEKINNLNDPQIDRERYVKIDTAFPGQTPVHNDPMAENGFASFSNYIQKMFLLHDTDAYNRCYEFLGQQYFNERIHQLGYKHTWLLHRMGEIDNNVTARHTNPMTFYRNDKIAYYKDIIYLKSWPTTIPFTAVYKQEAAYNSFDYYSNRPKILKGKGQEIDKKIVLEPFDFSAKNQFPLEEMHGFLQEILFPDDESKLNLSLGDYSFLYRYMGMYSDEMPEKYKQVYEDRGEATNYLFDDEVLKNRYPFMRVINNSGRGYGYMVENAYIVDFKNKVEFLVSIVIHCNRKEIIGEHYYEYDLIGKPFMEELGKLLYQEELKRKKKRLPDLTRFDVFHPDKTKAH